MKLGLGEGSMLSMIYANVSTYSDSSILELPILTRFLNICKILILFSMIT